MANLINNGGAAYVPPDLLNDSSIPDTNLDFFDIVITDLNPATNYAMQFAWVYEDKTLSPYSTSLDVYTNPITIPEVSSIETYWTNSTFKITFDRPEETVNSVVTSMADSFIITLTNGSISHSWTQNVGNSTQQTFVLDSTTASEIWRNSSTSSKQLPTSFTGVIKVVNADGTSSGVSFTSNSATDPISGRAIPDTEWAVTSLFRGYMVTIAQMTTAAEKEFLDYAELYEEETGNFVLIDTGYPILRHSEIGDLNNRSIKIRYKSKAGNYSQWSSVKVIAAANPSGYDDTAPTNNITLGSPTTTEDPGGIFQFGYQTVFPWTVPSDINTNTIYDDQRGYKVRFRIKGSTDEYTYLTVPGKTSSSTTLHGLLAGATYEVGITTYDVYDNTDTANWKTYADIVIPENASFKENAKLNVGPMEFGYGIGGSSVNKGIYLAPQNYWYVTGSTQTSDTAKFKVGGINDYMFWDGTKLAITGSLEAANARIKGDLDIGDPTAATPIDGQIRVRTANGRIEIGKLSSTVLASKIPTYAGTNQGIFAYNTSTGNYALISAADGTFYGNGVDISGTIKTTGDPGDYTGNTLTLTGGYIQADQVIFMSSPVVEIFGGNLFVNGGDAHITGNTKLDGSVRAVSLQWSPTYSTYSTYKVVGADEYGVLNSWFGVLTSGAYGTSNPPSNIGNNGDFLFST